MTREFYLLSFITCFKGEKTSQILTKTVFLSHLLLCLHFPFPTQSLGVTTHHFSSPFLKWYNGASLLILTWVQCVRVGRCSRGWKWWWGWGWGRGHRLSEAVSRTRGDTSAASRHLTPSPRHTSPSLASPRLLPCVRRQQNTLPRVYLLLAALLQSLDWDVWGVKAERWVIPVVCQIFPSFLK